MGYEVWFDKGDGTEASVFKRYDTLMESVNMFRLVEHDLADSKSYVAILFDGKISIVTKQPDLFTTTCEFIKGYPRVWIVEVH